MGNNPKKMLFVGLGSIGRQHLRSCLRLRPDFHYAAIRRNASSPLPDSERPKSYQEFQNIRDAKNFKPDLIWICNPSSLHAKSLKELSPIEGYVFVEKPLGSTNEELRLIDEVLSGIQDRFHYGCVLRFHPMVKKVSALLKEKALGRPYYYEIECGSDLRNWNPGRDYREIYRSKKEMGGGVALDLLHEWDLSLLWFGEVKEVRGFRAKTSDLEIDTDDLCLASLSHATGTKGQITLSYIRSSPTRCFRIECEKGAIEGDLLTGELKIGGTSESHPIDRIDLNDLLVKDVIESMEGNWKTTWNLKETITLNRRINEMEFLK